MIVSFEFPDPNRDGSMTIVVAVSRKFSRRRLIVSLG